MSIFPDKRDGKLTGRFRVELQLGGKRLRQRFDTLEQAKSFEAKSRVDMAHGKMPKEAKDRLEKGPKVDTLGQLIKAVDGSLWVGKSTERQSLQRLEGAISILGPSLMVESVALEDIDRLVKVLRSRNCAPGTINRYLSAVMVALKWALKRGHRVSPLPELEWQDEDEGRIRWITPAEEETLIDLLPQPEAYAVYISLRTGLRRGEILGLTTRDVEPGWVHLWGTGTKSGKGRSIPLTPDTYRAILEMFAVGVPSVETLRYWWNIAKDKMGLAPDEGFVFHACRHTFATRAVQAGVHPRVLQRLMGHSNLATTMRYMQVSDGMLTAAIEQMNHSPTGVISGVLTDQSQAGGLQGGVKALNPPLSRPGDYRKTLRKQGVKRDLGSSGETRGGSSPSARTMLNNEDNQ